MPLKTFEYTSLVLILVLTAVFKTNNALRFETFRHVFAQQKKASTKATTTVGVSNRLVNVELCSTMQSVQSVFADNAKSVDTLKSQILQLSASLDRGSYIE